jgi:hypothetical protein
MPPVFCKACCFLVNRPFFGLRAICCFKSPISYQASC